MQEVLAVLSKSSTRRSEKLLLSWYGLFMIRIDQMFNHNTAQCVFTETWDCGWDEVGIEVVLTYIRLAGLNKSGEAVTTNHSNLCR